MSIAAATLALLVGTAGAQISPVVQVADGKLRGTVDNGMTAFKGIPFAAPPTGVLRWRAPQPVARWHGVLDVSLPGPDCPQPANPGAQSPKGQSEDCLTLSLWAPESRTAVPLPVWVHGGAFAMGGTASPSENGAALASKGVIVVILNYRIGRLGWFAYPALTAESNRGGTADFGLMDQIAALRWVQANIAFFGGDPHRVTVAGESAGWSVGLLMTAPLARGLFTRAIIQSGFGRQPATPLAQAERAGTAFAQAHGAPDLAALRRLPSSAFVDKEVKDVDPTNLH